MTYQNNIWVAIPSLYIVRGEVLWVITSVSSKYITNAVFWVAMTAWCEQGCDLHNA